MSKLNCPSHGKQDKVALGMYRTGCLVCYNEMLRTGNSEDMFTVDERHRILSEAAALWQEMDLPPFEVRGWSHGEHMKWTVPELLRDAAERLKKKSLDGDL